MTSCSAALFELLAAAAVTRVIGLGARPDAFFLAIDRDAHAVGQTFKMLSLLPLVVGVLSGRRWEAVLAG